MIRSDIKIATNGINQAFFDLKIKEENIITAMTGVKFAACGNNLVKRTNEINIK